MSIHYNPVTRPQFPQTLLYDEGVERPEDLHYHFHSIVNYRSTFSNRFEVYARNTTGPAWWFEDGELHRGHTVGTGDFILVTAETQPVFAGGINWGNAYFVTEDAAQEWLIKQNICDYDIRYEELGDVWCIHYHYQGGRIMNNPIVGRKCCENPQMEELCERVLSHFWDLYQEYGDEADEMLDLADDMGISTAELIDMFHELGYEDTEDNKEEVSEDYD